MRESVVPELRQAIDSAFKILVVSHTRPDGDAVGSVLGLGLALQNAGKQVSMALQDGVPLSFTHLRGSKEIQRKPDREADLVIVLDASDLRRVGDLLNGFSKPDFNIDHHPTNENFAKHNLVEEQAVSTTQILAEIIPDLGLEITPDVAAALVTGLLTDTLGFRTSNINPQTLRLVASLMDTGIDMPTLYYKAMIERPFEALSYWGQGLTRIQREGKLVWTSLTLEDRQIANYPGRDDADLVNQLSTIRGADVRVIFVEQSDNQVKVSWRAQPGYDTSAVAAQFGGGGHKPASGATIDGTLEDIQERVLAATRKLFE